MKSVKMRLLTILSLSGILISANAQGLHTELDLDHEIQPIEIEANKLPLTPRLNLPEITTPSLRYSDKTVTTLVPNRATALDPVLWEAEMSTTPYRGYAALGWFPTWNASTLVGYRIIDRDKTQLNIWGNYQGNVYKRDYPVNADLESLGKMWWRDQQADMGINLRQDLGTKSTLSANVNLGYGHHTTAYRETLREPISAYRGALDLGFRSSITGLNYNVTAGYEYFKFKLRNFPTLDAQNIVKVGGDFASPLSASSQVGLKADINVLNDLTTHALIDLNPYFSHAARTFSALLGVKVGIMTKEPKTFHFAPNVVLGVTPSQFFALSLKAAGGVKTNSFNDLYNDLPALMPYGSYQMSRIPVDAEITATFGPLHGAWLQVSGAYARVNDWLLPTWGGYRSADFRGYKLSFNAGCAIKEIVTLSAGYATTPTHNASHGWYQWRDNARHVLTARATIKPLERLTIGAQYELRLSRKLYLNEDEINLNAYSGLNVSGSYALSSRLSVMAQACNLLTRHSLDASLRPTQGISGMIGAMYKF